MTWPCHIAFMGIIPWFCTVRCCDRSFDKTTALASPGAIDADRSANAWRAWSGQSCFTGPADLFGLWYPIIVAVMTFVIGSLLLVETKDVDIVEGSGVEAHLRS